ncbi:MAG: hypothetical protein ACMG6E_02420 [Candidatus Roizmanbacteria bacterium]
MMKKTQSPVKATTQEFIEIEDISDDVLLLKDMSAVMILESGSVNYDLLAPEEQAALIAAYGSLLSSLTFAIQIVIISQKKDISSYIDFLDLKIKGQTDEFWKGKLSSYKDFIHGIIDKNTLLEKHFYFVVGFSPLELGLHIKDAYSASHDYLFSRAKASLYPKRDHLLRLLKRMSLDGRVLQKQELIQLFYSLFNSASGASHITSVSSYTDSVVKAA